MLTKIKRFFLLLSFLTTTFTAKETQAQTVGLLYGITFGSLTGPAPYGTLFSYDPLAGKDSTLVTFYGYNGYDISGSLIQGKDGLLYGLTLGGGRYGDGTLFSFNTITNTQTALVNFNNVNGMYPTGSLIQASDGKLYGMTEEGGTNTYGVLFSYDPVTNIDTVLFNFTGPNGIYPLGGLVEGRKGLLYGMAWQGGTFSHGVFFRYNINTKQDTVLINFDDTGNGASPYFSTPILANDSTIYGMNSIGGKNNTGVLFSHNPFTMKDTFIVNLPYAKGYSHMGGLLQDTNGLIYGMQRQGGSPGLGTLFSYNIATGQDSVLVNFNNVNGSSPYGALIQGSDGILYGMTDSGGIDNFGTIFRYNIATGKDSVLHSFNDTDGAYPYGDLLEAMTLKISGRDTLNCYGDSNGWVKITPRGGKMPITYLWSNGSTVDSIGKLRAGPDTCVVKDARGITFVVPINIYQPGKLIISSVVNNACAGNYDSAWIIPSGGTQPFTYSWSNTATTDTVKGLSQGTYTCIVTDAKGCNKSTTAKIINPQPLKIDSVVSTPATWPTYMNGTAKVYISGGMPLGDSNIPGYIFSYLWTFGGDSAYVKGLPPGLDSIVVSNACGSVVGVTQVPSGLNSVIDLGNNVKIYPVPSRGPISILMRGSGFKAITITDELGREVFHQQLQANYFDNTIHPDLSAQPDGIYIVQFVTEQSTIVRKLVIQK